MTFTDLMSQNFKTTQNNKSDQITMNLHRFDVQTIKNVELRRKPFKTAKLQKWSKYNDLHRFDVKSNHITNWICTDLTSKRSKMSRYVAKHSNNAKLQKRSNYNEFASIWRQNDQKCCYVAKHSNNAKLQKWSKYNDWATIWCHKTSKQLKTTKVIKLRWICIDLTSKRSKMLSYVANHSKPLNYKSDQNTMTCIDLTSKVIT